MLNALIKEVARDHDFVSIKDAVSAGMKEQLVAGLSGSARQLMMAGLHQELERPLLIVTHNIFSAQKIADDLQEALPEGSVLFYPANELVAAESAISSPETIAQRIEVLTRCADGFKGVLVVPFSGLRRFVPDPDAIRSAQLTIEEGSTLDLEAFLMRMVELGYSRVERVETRGEMSVRGGIIDFFPTTSTLAYRVELFDDEVDSIRTFDPEDQRSIDKVKRVRILPSRELVASGERMKQGADAAAALLEKQLDRMTDRKAKTALQQEIGREIDLLRQQIHFPEMYKYVSLIYPERQTLYDYMPEDTLLLMDEPSRLLDTAAQLERDEAEWNLHLLQSGKSLPDLPLALEGDSSIYQRPFQTLFLSLFVRQIPRTHPGQVVNVVSRTMQDFHGQMNVLKAEMERWKKSNMRVIMLAGDDERAARIRQVLEDYEIETPEIMRGHLQGGFELPSAHLVVVTEGELFAQKQRKVRKSTSTKQIDNAERIKSYTELKVGDYVVHQNHGIGKYLGIGTLEVAGIHKDYMHIMYAGGDKLSVPIEQIDLIQKYVGAEDKEPKVYKLGGNEWTRVKTKVRSSVQDIADDLIKLYAERQASAGYSFDKDTPDQNDFENTFPYEETRDQLRAIQEIKGDMEMTRPMDRLLCGDVGYGKTEVAIRAAFKAAIEGKQVAILVPTTILAQQHYETFRERFEGYPFNIGVLSRFRSRKEQNETIKGVKQGTIDVIIGTHRILSQDLVFKDLGLLIVDEEQRFGVTHKEKLKRLKTNVDVLTLTATPIPRTLHMSMLGVRDLSVIETPPENRFPVQTYVVEYSPTLVREAIERELARGGQVYYLYNRVQGIHEKAAEISELVPDARVSVGHGQMSEQELERTILDFLEGESDVLVSTSIIETGVDIPNVNTLIVHDADKMGLSQLYQMRGRVGRSNRIAYAYFSYQKDKVLTEVAEKRLQSIKEFTELGSGFKIAMRDLSIRGAGNLLGAEQSGFIASVGFDLYSQMLAEEIQKRKISMLGEAPAEDKHWSTMIDLSIDAYLPADYIYDSIQKIEIYKKVAAATTFEDVLELEDELLDRFGELPEAVVRLMQVARFKIYGRSYGIESIARKGDDLAVTFYDGQEKAADPSKLAQIGNRFESSVQFKQGTPLAFQIKGRNLPESGRLETLERVLDALQEAFKSKGELHDAVKS